MQEDEAGRDVLTRLFQGEMIKHFAISNKLLTEIVAVLQQNQVLLFQMDKNIEKLKSNSY